MWLNNVVSKSLQKSSQKLLYYVATHVMYFFFFIAPLRYPLTCSIWYFSWLRLNFGVFRKSLSKTRVLSSEIKLDNDATEVAIWLFFRVFFLLNFEILIYFLTCYVLTSSIKFTRVINIRPSSFMSRILFLRASRSK